MRNLLLSVTLISVLVLNARSQQLPLRIGYADTEYILTQMPETIESSEKLKGTQEKLKNDYADLQQKFKKQYADYSVTSKTMSDTARARNEQHLQELSAELKRFEQDAQSTLENARRLYMAPAYLKVGSAIKAVAAENGFSVVLPQKIGNYNFLLYYDKKLDISNLVLKKLGVTPSADK